jgi:hypothetical protein
MKAFRTLFAIAFSFLLIVAQTVFAADARATPSKSCACCSCRKMNCCATQSTPAPERPLSPQPIRSSVQNNLQFVAVVVAFLSQSPRVPSEKFVPPVSTSSRSAAVPVYVRNCSYLI